MYAYACCAYSAHIVMWITINNRPLNIINDQGLRGLLTAG
jgi:hypothetical protein